MTEYNDGFTLKEQAEFKRNAQQKMHLSHNFLLQSANTLIKNLKLKVGEQDSYIAELEDKNKEYEKQLSSAKILISSLQSDKQKLINGLMKEEFAKKFESEIKDLKATIKKLRQDRDDLIWRLNIQQ